MFNRDFYPTPEGVIAHMLDGEQLNGKNVLEPSAGNGNIVDYCKRAGANVIACELHPDLRKIVSAKCSVLSEDFMKVSSDQVSHLDYIVMNPPFSADERHIHHAFNIAPAGCRIIALCNLDTIKRGYYRAQEELRAIVNNYGSYEDLGSCFTDAERTTDVEVALIRLQKPGGGYEKEFEGFFMDDDPAEAQVTGIMPYNFVRDIVNRYKSAVEIYDQQLDTAVRLNDMVGTFFTEKVGFQCSNDQYQVNRNQFKKDLQKSAWQFIFSKMNMQKYATRGLRADINKFVETQHNIPFTMRNIYRMIEIVIGTQGQRMDRAMLEVFDKLTQHYHENRYNVEGWKTNSHYLINRRFIMPYVAEKDWKGGTVSLKIWGGQGELIQDLQKALCHMEGTNYDTLNKPERFSYLSVGEWHDWGYLRFKLFKKGTGHFEFKDADVWARFNQHIARIKGYPLFEETKAKGRAKAAA